LILRRVPKLIGVTVTATLLAGMLAPSPAGATPDTEMQPSSAPSCVIEGTFAISGNWDGIGGDGVGTVAPNSNGDLLWQLRNGPNSGPADYTFIFGRVGDRPVVGNWDGIGGDGIGAVRGTGSSWRWFLRNGPNGGGGVADHDFVYGPAGGHPTAGNWDGIGGDGPGVVTSFNWYLRNGPSGGPHEYTFVYTGGTNGWPVTGNWDGIGGDGVGLASRASERTWWALRNGPNNGPPEYGPFQFGTESGCWVTGNWDGIGGDGIGIVYPRPGGDLQWHLRQGPNPGPHEIELYYGRV
jgi:hypothetical protein